MEKQKNNLRKIVFGIAFFASMLIMTACKERKEQTQENTVYRGKVNVMQIDIHTAVINHNSESCKQNIAGSKVNEKDPSEVQVKQEPRISNWLLNLISGRSDFLSFVTNI